MATVTKDFRLKAGLVVEGFEGIGKQVVAGYYSGSLCIYADQNADKI